MVSLANKVITIVGAVSEWLTRKLAIKYRISTTVQIQAKLPAKFDMIAFSYKPHELYYPRVCTPIAIDVMDFLFCRVA